MKRLILLVLIAFPLFLCAQPSKKVRKVVPVITQQTFYLNGGMRATFGGKSRTYFQIDLPKNTVEWYYIFTTLEGEVPSAASLNLVPQLTRLVDPTGITAIAASAIMCPTGSNSCDIVLLRDRKNAQAFNDKVDNLGGTYYYIKAPSRENFRNGTVQIQDLVSGTCFLGFKNPSASTGITITFEVAAIVEEQDPDYEKAVGYGNLGWKAYESGDLERCILYSKKALELAPDLIFVKANLGLCYLQKGEEFTATDYYMDALAGVKKLANQGEKTAYIAAIIKDINDAIEKGINMPGSKEILEIYMQEQKRIQ